MTQALPPEPVKDPRDDGMSLDFSVPDDMSAPPAQAPAPAASPQAIEFDLSGISLDLDLPEQASAKAPPSGFADIDMTALEEEGSSDPLARKLELAEEFRQIGDMEGARDLLQEVLAKSSGAVKAKAQGMLEALG